MLILLTLFRRLLVLLATCFAFAGNGLAGEVAIQLVKIKETNELVTIDVKLSGKTLYEAAAQNNPNRLTISFIASNFDLPLGAGRKRQGVIKSYRYGVEKGKATLVFDSTKPLLILTSALAKKGRDANFSITLQTTDSKTFASVAKPPPIAKIDTEPVIEAPAVAALPTAVATGPHRVVVIDPGHGGIDPGAISKSGTLEKTVVLDYAKALQAELEKAGHIVYLTRGGDKFQSLPNRVKFAREKKADLFIALHADTLRGPSADGMTFYTLSKTASDAEAEAFAQKENKADVVAGLPFIKDNPDVADILVELAQHESMNHAVFLSRMAVEKLKPVTPFTGLPIRSAGFTVLKTPEIPSILIELGFLSSPEDEKRLQSASWRNRTARELASAVDAYFEENVPVNSISAANNPQ
jgi:N-acetylmuramoyl-L-alanine amidase